MSFDVALLSGGDLAELKGFENGTFLLTSDASSNDGGMECGRLCEPVKDRLRGRAGRGPVDPLLLGELLAVVDLCDLRKSTW